MDTELLLAAAAQPFSPADLSARTFRVRLAEADVPIPTTPNGGREGYTYVLTREAIESCGASMVGKPLHLTPDLGDHYLTAADGTRRIAPAYGFVTGQELVQDGERWFWEVEGEWWPEQDPVLSEKLLAMADELGGSWEINSRVRTDEDEKAKYITGFGSRGLAILKQSRAAYRELSELLAASAAGLGQPSLDPGETPLEAVGENADHAAVHTGEASLDLAPAGECEVDELKQLLETLGLRVEALTAAAQQTDEKLEAMGQGTAEAMKRLMDHMTAADTPAEDTQIAASGVISMIREHAKQAGRAADGMTPTDTYFYASELIGAEAPEVLELAAAQRDLAEKLAAAGVESVDVLVAEHLQVTEALAAAEAEAQAQRMARVKAALGVELADEKLAAVAATFSDEDLERLEARAAKPAPVDPEAAPEGEDEGALAGSAQVHDADQVAPHSAATMGQIKDQLRKSGVTDPGALRRVSAERYAAARGR